MTVSPEFIREKFKQFNDLCFEGRLPEIPIKLRNARGYLGKVTFRTRRGWFGRVLCNDDYTLRISTHYDLPEEIWEDVVIHELIHYYIALNRLRDTSAHGRLFRKMMSDINENYNRHITISYRIKP